MKKIIERLKEKYQPKKIILFGSYAWGDPSDESDIDLLIIKSTTKPFHKRWVEVCRLVREIVLTTPFSLFVFTSEEIENRLKVGDQFFKKILQEGKLLYAK